MITANLIINIKQSFGPDLYLFCNNYSLIGKWMLATNWLFSGWVGKWNEKMEIQEITSIAPTSPTQTSTTNSISITIGRK